MQNIDSKLSRRLGLFNTNPEQFTQYYLQNIVETKRKYFLSWKLKMQEHI